jgi:hypothetical protein
VTIEGQQRLQQTVALAHMQVRGLVPEGDDRGPMLNLQQRLQQTVALAHMQVRGLVPEDGNRRPMLNLQQ